MPQIIDLNLIFPKIHHSTTLHLDDQRLLLLGDQLLGSLLQSALVGMAKDLRLIQSRKSRLLHLSPNHDQKLRLFQRGYISIVSQVMKIEIHRFLDFFTNRVIWEQKMGQVEFQYHPDRPHQLRNHLFKSLFELK